MTVKSLPLTLAVLLALGAGGVTAQDKVGTVHFPTSCSAAVQGDFGRAVAMLHSFWFSASTAAFAAVAQADPGCGIAHWGVAMNLLGNPFGWPPSPKALADGWAAVERAKTAGAKTQRERDYISAIETFYKDPDTVDHRTRALGYRQAMDQLTARYPDDPEAAVFYALALNATALPTDKTYADQLKAAGILEKVFAAEPQHPGVAHYLIHSYDYPPIAEKGLTAARRYAAIAPAAPHALHMPSHIFTRRGFWGESIEANRASINAISSHFDQLHALDYLAYAYLQTAQDAAAKRVVDQVSELPKVNVEHFVTGFALATIPSRYALERGRWADAARLELFGKEFPWSRFRADRGAARAPSLPADRTKARTHSSDLIASGGKGETERAEFREAKAFLGKSPPTERGSDEATRVLEARSRRYRDVRRRRHAPCGRPGGVGPERGGPGGRPPRDDQRRGQRVRHLCEGREARHDQRAADSARAWRHTARRARAGLPPRVRPGFRAPRGLARLQSHGAEPPQQLRGPQGGPVQGRRADPESRPPRSLRRPPRPRTPRARQAPARPHAPCGRRGHLLPSRRRHPGRHGGRGPARPRSAGGAGAQGGPLEGSDGRRRARLYLGPDPAAHRFRAAAGGRPPRGRP